MKVDIVGAGRVGSAAAFSMVLRASCSDILLVDKDDAKAAAQAADTADAAPVAHATRVTGGSLADLAGSRVVVLAAGITQKPGQDRQEMLKNNAAIYREIIPAVAQAATEAVIVDAATPVDVMTSLAVQLAGPVFSGRIFGTGTVLDTARLRAAIALRAGLDPQHVHSYVIGEHGALSLGRWPISPGCLWNATLRSAAFPGVTPCATRYPMRSSAPPRASSRGRARPTTAWGQASPK